MKAWMLVVVLLSGCQVTGKVILEKEIDDTAVRVEAELVNFRVSNR